MNIFSNLFSSFNQASRKKIQSDIADRESRHQLVEAHIRHGLPLQIRAMREKMKWTQKDLAVKLGTTQNAVSRLENPRTGQPTITTLEKIAEAFDVALIVKFAPFSEFVDSLADMSPSSVSVPSYEQEEKAMRTNVTLAQFSKDVALWHTFSAPVFKGEPVSSPLPVRWPSYGLPLMSVGALVDTSRAIPKGMNLPQGSFVTPTVDEADMVDVDIYRNKAFEVEMSL